MTKKMISDYLERLEKAKANRSDSNCIGTALYLAGAVEKDCYVPTWKAYKRFLGNLRETNKLIEGSLVAWTPGWGITWPKTLMLPRFGKSAYHLGIITQIDPFLVTHRDGRKGPVCIDDNFERIDDDYNKYGRLEVNFYLPKSLEV